MLNEIVFMFVWIFHSQIEEEPSEEETAPPTWKDRLMALIKSKDETHEEEDLNAGLITTYNRLIINTVNTWAKTEFIQDQELIRQMFSLLHRQYDAAGEVRRATCDLTNLSMTFNSQIPFT